VNKVLRSTLVALSFVFTFFFSVADLKGEIINVAAFVDQLKDNFNNIKDLDYFKSTEAFIKIYNFKIGFKWGEKERGSGALFSTLPTIPLKIEIEKNEEAKEDKKFALLDFAKLIAENELKKGLKKGLNDYKDLPGFSNLADLVKIIGTELTPIKFFAIKLATLMNQPFKGQEIRQKVEVLRLLVRLSQSGVFNTLDKNKPLSSYIPKNFMEVFAGTSISQQWIDFIDNIWKTLAEGVSKYEFDADGAYDKNKLGVSCSGFVFNNPKFAQFCFDKLKDKQDDDFSNFEETIETIAKVSDGQVICFEDFKEVGDRENYLFVGKKDFGRINGDSIDLPEELKNEVLSNDDSTIKFVDVNENEKWIVFASDKLSMFDTVKMLFVTLLKTFEEYKDIKSQDINGFLLEQEEVQEELSENDILLQGFYAQKDVLNIQLKALGLAKEKLRTEIEKLQQAGVKTGLKQKYLDSLLVKFDEKAKQQDELISEVDQIVEEIIELGGNGFLEEINLDETSNKESVAKKLLKFVLNTFFKSPEFEGMLKDINESNDVKYKKIKEDLFKRLSYIFKNSEHVKDHLDVYEYLIKNLFPELHDTFDNLTNDLKDEDDVEQLIGKALLGMAA